VDPHPGGSGDATAGRGRGAIGGRLAAPPAFLFLLILVLVFLIIIIIFFVVIFIGDEQ
jgi:hypothetical protein